VVVNGGRERGSEPPNLERSAIACAADKPLPPLAQVARSSIGGLNKMCQCKTPKLRGEPLLRYDRASPRARSSRLGLGFLASRFYKWFETGRSLVSKLRASRFAFLRGRYSEFLRDCSGTGVVGQVSCGTIKTLTENPSVGGSIPSLAISISNHLQPLPGPTIHSVPAKVPYSRTSGLF